MELIMPATISSLELVLLTILFILALLWLRTRGKLATALKKIKDSEAEYRTLLAKYDSLIKKYEELKVENEENAVECQVIDDEYALLSAEHDKLKKSYDSLDQTYQEVKVRASQLSEKYSSISSLDQAVAQSNQELRRARQEIEELRESYKSKRKIYDRLEHEIAIFDEKLELSNLGYYEPHFDYGTSDRFKQEIESVRAEQKALLYIEQAAICTTEWRVNNSLREGETMTKRALKLTLRAFNNECEAAISNVRWNNIKTMELRIRKARAAIEKLNKSNSIEITEDYFQLKMKELRLTYEYSEKLRQEKIERAEEKRRLREEQQLIKDKEKSESQQKKYEQLLAKAKAEAEKATGGKLETLRSNVLKLEQQLAEAKARSERATSMAQQTKAGYVYIISNIGSFGHNVFKIGMTRRLEPMERVKELGDASVPFIFDVHALIYSDDAPALEAELHRHFSQQRLNLVNNRKEFFRVSLIDIKEKLAELKPEVEVVSDTEAKDYNQTLIMRGELNSQKQTQNEKPPIEI